MTVVLAYSELSVGGSVEGSVVTVTRTACWDNRRFRSTGLLEMQRSWAHGHGVASVWTARRRIYSGLNSLNNNGNKNISWRRWTARRCLTPNRQSRCTQSWTPRWPLPRSNFAQIFGLKYLESLRYRVALFPVKCKKLLRINSRIFVDYLWTKIDGNNVSRIAVSYKSYVGKCEWHWSEASGHN